MNAHTPGPWIATQAPTSAGSAFRIGSAGAEKGCAWIYADGIRKGIDDALPRSLELAANARLIAAAPDMLSVLLKLRRGDLHQRVRPLYDEAQAAIAKATGEQS